MTDLLPVPLSVLDLAPVGEGHTPADALRASTDLDFSAANTLPALDVYRSSFRPSEVLEEPYVMLGVAVLCADDHARAAYLSKPAELSFLRLRSGRPGRFPTPEEAAAFNPTPAGREAINAWTASRVVGDSEEVAGQLTELVARTGADELMVTTMAHDHGDRLRSYELLAAMAGRPLDAPVAYVD